jgi:hypothetical protein
MSEGTRTGGTAFPSQIGGTVGLWAPIVVLETYLAFTVFLHFMGPVEWHIPNAAKLYAFLVVNYGGLWAGYRWGLQRGLWVIEQGPSRHAGVLRVHPYMLHLIMFSMLFTIFATTVKLLAIRGGIDQVLSTLANPGEAYLQAQLVAQLDRDGQPPPVQGYSTLFQLSTVLSAFQGMFLPLAIACWRRLPLLHRLVFFVALLSLLIYGIGIGAQSGFGFLLFSIVPVVLYKIVIERPIFRIRRGIQLSASRLQSAGRLALLGVAGSVMLFALVVFFQLDRAETSGGLESAADSALVGSHGTHVSRGFPLFGDDNLSFGIVMACKYISHGYTGLALAMEMPFEWSYGLGSSKGMQVVFRDYLGGPDLFDKSYLVRSDAQNDWPALVWWSTIFPWIASDTTFYGTVLVMLGVGLAIGRLWMVVAVTGNPIAFVPLGQLFILVFMFPANNALLQTLDGVFAFMGMLVVYFVGKRMYLARERPSARIADAEDAPIG